MTPMPVIYPSTLLALFAAIFGPTTAPAFRELSRELLPLPTLPVSTLANASFRVVFPTQVSHYDACPVLHVLGMMPDRELFHEGEDVEVVGLEVLFIFVVV